jgi:hypothetical protein
MARCARRGCHHWRPGFLVRLTGLGLSLDDKWYCSAQCLGIAVRERLAHAAPIVPPTVPAASQPRLGGVLATQKRLSLAVVEEAASVQARTGLRIGTQLVELGLVTRLDVLRALAAQSGVGFLTALDPARLTLAPGNLSPAVVHALGVVPFEADRRHDVLKVACTAPVPRGSLAALRELTGSIIEPYLVADDLWPAILQAYGAGSRAIAAAPTTMSDLESLAARVAAAAREAGSVRMSEARCADSLWVRLDAGGQVEELLLMSESNRQKVPEAASRPRRKPRRSRPVAAAATSPAEAPAVAPAAVALASPVVPVRVAVRAVKAPAPRALDEEAVPVDDGMDLSFLEAWDSRQVPLSEL